MYRHLHTPEELGESKATGWRMEVEPRQWQEFVLFLPALGPRCQIDTKRVLEASSPDKRDRVVVKVKNVSCSSTLPHIP